MPTVNLTVGETGASLQYLARLADRGYVQDAGFDESNFSWSPVHCPVWENVQIGPRNRP